MLPRASYEKDIVAELVVRPFAPSLDTFLRLMLYFLRLPKAHYVTALYLDFRISRISSILFVA